MFLEGAGGEGELGWLWQFSGGDFFLCVCVCFGVLFVCLVLMGFLCFQLEPCPAVVGVFVFGGAAESKDLCALHPCCEMQACACFASLAEGFVFFFFFKKKKSPICVVFL